VRVEQTQEQLCLILQTIQANESKWEPVQLFPSVSKILNKMSLYRIPNAHKKVSYNKRIFTFIHFTFSSLRVRCRGRGRKWIQPSFMWYFYTSRSVHGIGLEKVVYRTINTWHAYNIQAHTIHSNISQWLSQSKNLKAQSNLKISTCYLGWVDILNLCGVVCYMYLQLWKRSEGLCVSEWVNSNVISSCTTQRIIQENIKKIHLHMIQLHFFPCMCFLSWFEQQRYDGTSDNEREHILLLELN